MDEDVFFLQYKLPVAVSVYQKVLKLEIKENEVYILEILTFVKSFGVSAGRYIDIVNNIHKRFLHLLYCM